MADESKPTTSYAQGKDPYAKKGKEKGLGSILKDNVKGAFTSSKEPEILSENPYAPKTTTPVTKEGVDATKKLIGEKFGGKGGAGGGGPAVEAGKVKTVEEIEPINSEKTPENTGMSTPTPSDFLGQGDIDTANREFAEQEKERKEKTEVPQVENVPEEGGSDENPEGAPEEGGKKKPGLTERFVNWYTNDETGLHSANEQKEIDDKKAEEAKMAEQEARRDGTFVDTSTIEYNEKPQDDGKTDENPDKIPEKPVTEEDYTARYGQVAVDSAKRWGKLLALPVAQGILDSNFGDNTVAAFDSTRKILRSFLTGNPMSAASTILGESVNNLNRFSDSADKIGKRMGIAVGADPTILEGTIVGRSFKKRAEEDRQATSAALKVVDDAMVSLGEDSLENLTPEKLSQFYDTIGQANSQAVATLKSYFNGDENVTKRDRDLALRQIEVYGSVMDDIAKKSKQDKEKYAADAAWLRKMGSNRNRMEKMRRDIEHKRRYDSATPLGKMSIDLLGKNVTINPAGEPVRQRDITRMKNTLEAKLASDELSPQDRAAYEKALTRITELATPYDEKQWQKMLDETNDKGRIIATLTSKRIPVDKNGSYDSFHAKTVARRAREYITTHPDITDADRKLYEQIASEADMMAKTAAQLEREQELRAFRRKFDKANVVQRDIYRILTDNQRKTWNLDEDGIPASPGQMKMLRTRLRDELAGGTVSGRIANEFEQVIDKIDEKLTPGKEQENRRYREQLEQSGVYDPTGTIRLSKVFDTLRTRRDMRFDIKTGLPASPSDYPSLRRQIENAMSDPAYLAAHSEGTIPAVLKSQLESYMTNVLDPAMRKDYQVRADEKRKNATPEQMRVYNLLDDRQVAEWNLDANGMPGSKTQKRNLRNRIENALLDPSIPDPEKAALKAMRDDITKGLRTEFERSNEEYRESLYSGQKMGLAYVYDTLTRNRHIRFDPNTNLPSSPKDYERVRSSILNAMNDPTYMSDHPDLNGHAANDVLQHYLDNILEPAMRSQRDKDYEEWKRNAQDDNVRLLGEALGGAKGSIRIKPDGSISKGSRASAIRRVQDYLFHSNLPADDPGRQYLMDRAAEWQQAIDVDNMEKKLTTKKKKALEDDTKSIAERLGSLWDVDNVALESITGKALSAHQVDSSANKAALMQTAYMKKNYPLVYNALTEYDSIDEMASDGPEMNDDELREEAKRLLADPMYIANQHAVDNLRMASDTQRFQKAIHNAGQALQIDPQEIQRDIDRLSVLSYQTIQSKSEDPTKVTDYIPLSADSPYQKELDALMDKYKLRGRFKASGKKGAVNLGPVAVDDTKTDGRGTHFMFSDYTQNNIQNFAIQFNININGEFGNYNPQGDAAGGIPTGTGDTNDASEPEKGKVKKEKVKKEADGEKPKKISKENFASEIHYKESDDAPEDLRGMFSTDDGTGNHIPMSKEDVSTLLNSARNANSLKTSDEVKAVLDDIDGRMQFDESELAKRAQFYADKYSEMYGKKIPANTQGLVDKKIYGIDGGVSNVKKLLIERGKLQQRYNQLVTEEAARKEEEERKARRQQDERDADAAIQEYGDVLEDEGFRNYEDRESWRGRKDYWGEQDEDTINRIFGDLNPNVRTPAPDVPPAPEEEQTDEEKDKDIVPPEEEAGGETPQAPEIKGSRFRRNANGTLEIPDELKVPDTKFFRRNNSNAGPGFDEKLYGTSHAAHAISSMISEIGGKIANKSDNMSGSGGNLVLAPEYKSSLKLFSDHINKLDEEGNTGESLADKYYLVSLFKRQGMDGEFSPTSGSKKYAAMNAKEKNKERKSLNDLFYSTFSKDIANFDELSQDEAFVNNLNEDYNAINQFLHEEDMSKIPDEVLNKVGSLHKDIFERTGRYAKSEEEKQVDEKKKAEEEAAAKKRKQEIDAINKARMERYEKFKKEHSDKVAGLITDPSTIPLDKWNGNVNPKKIPIVTSEGKEIKNLGEMLPDIDKLNSIINYTVDLDTAKKNYKEVASGIKGNLDAIQEEYDLWMDQITRAKGLDPSVRENNYVNKDLLDKINPFYNRLTSTQDIFKLLNEAKNNLDGDYLEKYNEVKGINERGRKDSNETPKVGSTSSTYRTDANKDSRGTVGSGQVVDQEKVDERRTELDNFQNHLKEIDKENVVSHTEFNNDSKYFKELSSKEGELDEETIGEFKSMYDKYTKVYDAYLADATKFAATLASSDDNFLSGELAGAYFGGASPDNVRILLNNLKDKLKGKSPEKKTETEEVEQPAEPEKPIDEKPVDEKPKRKRKVKVEPIADEPPIEPKSDKNYTIPSLDEIDKTFSDKQRYKNLTKMSGHVKTVQDMYSNACKLLNDLHAEVLNGRMSRDDAENEIREKTGHSLNTLYPALGKLKGFIGDSGVDKDTLPRFPNKFGVAEVITGHENDDPIVKRSIRVKKYQDEGDGDLHILPMDLPDADTFERFIGPNVKNINPTDIRRARTAYEDVMDRLYAIKHFYEISDKGKQTKKMKTMFYQRRNGKNITSDNVVKVAWKLHDLLKARGEDVEEPYLPRPVTAPKKIVTTNKSMSSRDAMKALLDEKMEEHNARFEAYNSVDKRRFVQ